MHENGAVRVLYDEIWNIGRASRFVAFQEKIIILSLSTHGRFLQAKGQGYRHGLQAWAGASKGAKYYDYDIMCIHII